jgi:hypothetical protein
LIGTEDNGPQFFSPARIQAAREYQAKKEAKELAERQKKADEKARKALEKEGKEAKRQIDGDERRRKR